MSPPGDAHQAAWYLIDRCGTGAAWIAANYAETLRKRGDTEIYANWLRIVELVTEYLKETRSVGVAELNRRSKLEPWFGIIAQAKGRWVQYESCVYL